MSVQFPSTKSERQPLLQKTDVERGAYLVPPVQRMDQGGGPSAGSPAPLAPPPSMLEVAAGSYSEFSPAYRVLAEAGKLCTKYQRENIADVFTGADLPQNSTLLQQRRQLMLWCCGLCSPCYYFTHKDFTVPPKHVGMLLDNGYDYIFAQPGVHSHVTACGTLSYEGHKSLDTLDGIVWGNRTYIQIKEGYIGYAEDCGQPVLLPPGPHVWTSETLIYKDSKSLNKNVIDLGTLTIVTVDEGYAAITSDNGQQKVLMGGDTYLLDNANWEFQTYLPLKIFSMDLPKRMQCTSADNINLEVDANVTWRIDDPTTCAAMAASTTSADGEDVHADISAIEHDVLDQAKASLSAFIGGVNYSECFHMSAGAAHGNGIMAAENHRSIHPETGQAVLLEPEPEHDYKSGADEIAMSVAGTAENPLYDMTKMNTAVAHANEITQTYGVKVLGINVITAVPDKNLTSALAKGAVAAAEALQTETVARGNANSVKIQAEADQLAEIIRAKGKAQSLEVEAEGAKRAEILRAEGEAAGINSIATAISTQGGQMAMTQRIAETYVMQLGEMSKNANMLIVPDKPNDISGVVATAMSISQAVSSGQ